MRAKLGTPDVESQGKLNALLEVSGIMAKLLAPPGGEREGGTMQTVFDLLKFVAALVFVAAFIYYWITEGLPPRGRGRWRSVLSGRSAREREQAARPRQRPQGSPRMGGANDYRKKDS